MNILVMQTAFLGDLLLSIPLLKRLRLQFPNAQITLYCRQGLGAVFLELILVDRVVMADKTSRASLKSSLRELQQDEYDFIICPHQSFRTALVVSRLKSPLKIGFKRWWNFWVFHRRVTRPMHHPEAVRQIYLLSQLDDYVKAILTAKLNPGTRSKIATNFELFWRDQMDHISSIHPASDESIEILAPTLKEASMSIRHLLPAGVLREVQQINNGQEPIIFLAPGSVWATKMWGGYLELAHLFSEQGYRVVFIGSAAEQVANTKMSLQIKNAVDLSGKTSLLESLCWLSLGVGLVANDSGAMHLASAVELPTVAIFGPTDLSLGYRPWQNRSSVVQKKLSCRPCGKHGAKECPIKTHECMAAITANEVFEAFIYLVS